MSIEIGDFFIIKKSSYNKKCKHLNTTFQVVSKSKSELSVYYHDRRTNNNCKCGICTSFSNISDKLKCIPVDQVELYEKYKSYLRKKKLKIILK